MTGVQTCALPICGNGGYTTCGCTDGGQNGLYDDGAGSGGKRFVGGSTIPSGPGQGGGGGGGGWYGGGSGGGDCAGNMGGGGGGGSSWAPTTGCVVSGARKTAPNASDPDYAPGVAAGSDTAAGGDGRIVVYW